MDFDELSWYVELLIIFVLFPILNSIFLWRIFDKRWQKIVFAFGIGMATPFLNYVIMFCVWFMGIDHSRCFDWEYTWIQSVVTMTLCGGFSCCLYALERRRRKLKSDLTKNKPENPV
ncbi:MAG: hypothetical protein ACYSPI_05630 [Planctomycetota bacterium]|jgi:hypothetical protein